MHEPTIPMLSLNDEAKAVIAVSVRQDHHII
jgi:hypothetical protein